MILAMDVVANLALLAIDAAVIVLLWRKRDPKRFAMLLAACGLAAPFCALFSLSVVGLFGVMRLLAWAIFVHAAVVLACGTILLWKPHRKSAIPAAVLAALIALVGIDAFFVEPRRLEVTEIRLTSSKVTRPLRIAIVADLQTDEIGEYERMALRRAAAGRPDLILFAGDYIQEHPRREGALFSLLRQAMVEGRVQGTLGAVAVQGNCDSSEWKSGFEGTSVICMSETESRRFGEVRVTGLSMVDSFNDRLRLAREEEFHIVVGHSPDFALGDVQADLLVAGHTHGGQVRLPFIGPLITLSQIPRAWAAGMTALEGGRTLIVSRGIGMERGVAPRLRFLCRPELVIVEIVPSK